MDVEQREQRGGDFRGALDFGEGAADDLRAHSLSLAEALGGFVVGGGVDDRDFVFAGLAHRGGDLAEAVDDLALDLGDHAFVAEGDFADVGRAKAKTPLRRRR